MHPVLEVLGQRTEAGSLPGQRRDNFKLGLAVEGGGMRGVVSAGMLLGLAQLGLRPALDAVYGASAGALNGADPGGPQEARPVPGLSHGQGGRRPEGLGLAGGHQLAPGLQGGGLLGQPAQAGGSGRL
ncbi:MAG: patatin-like phospholipase family protein [Deltaproteobacteria bacterium]|nr:patatin-like phospholipase family protein [Deltaproteobacteria bacterium]